MFYSRLLSRRKRSTDIVQRRTSLVEKELEPALVGGRRSHVPRIPLDPALLIHPGQDLLEESRRIALGDTELGDPDRLVEGGVEVCHVSLEVLGLVPGVPVGGDKVDLAVAAGRHELLEPVDALVGAGAVGYGGAADFQTAGERLDVLLVSGYGVGDGHAGAAATGGC